MNLTAPRDFESETMRYEYPLGKDSVVFDCGGFHGQWAAEISKRYGCKIVVFEPVFLDECKKSVDGKPNVTVVPSAVGAFSRKAEFGVANDSTGIFVKNDVKKVDVIGIEKALEEYAPNGVDLLKLNIEGMEFELLDELCGSGLIKKFKYIQVQFHMIDKNVEKRVEFLVKNIQKTHVLEWGRNPFFWLSFRRVKDESRFVSRSQAGQDVFAYHVNNKKADGFFVEIGSSDPVAFNNTVALEEIGWTGIMSDISETARDLARTRRIVPFHWVDSTKADWKAIIGRSWVDYLSLDVDSATLDTLKRLPLKDVQFGCITIEHDFYRFGAEPRDQMRKILLDAGYYLTAMDVKDAGLEFEDWWVHGSLREDARKFLSTSKDWKEVVACVH